MKEQKYNSIPDPKDNFKVPENYFETFEEQLFSKLGSITIAPKRKTHFIQRYIYIGTAASITLLIGLGFLFNDSTEETPLSNQDIENYLQIYPVGLSSEITKEFTDSDLKALEQSLNIDDLKLDEYLLSSTDIEYYLNE